MLVRLHKSDNTPGTHHLIMENLFVEIILKLAMTYGFLCEKGALTQLEM